MQSAFIFWSDLFLMARAEIFGFLVETISKIVLPTTRYLNIIKSSDREKNFANMYEADSRGILKLLEQYFSRKHHCS